MEELRNKLSILAEICEKLPHNKKPILVGGSAVEFYTKAPSKSIYIEIIADRIALLPVLINMNFTTRGRYLYTKDLGIEVVGESAEGRRFNDHEFEGKMIRVLCIEDLIIERLKVGKLWKSQIDIEQAQVLVRKYASEFDHDYFIKRMNEEKLDPELLGLN